MEKKNFNQTGTSSFKEGDSRQEKKKETEEHPKEVHHPRNKKTAAKAPEGRPAEVTKKGHGRDKKTKENRFAVWKAEKHKRLHPSSSTGKGTMRCFKKERKLIADKTK